MWTDIVYQTGINDWFRFKKKCPVYWRGKEEESLWQQGWDYAKEQERSR